MKICEQCGLMFGGKHKAGGVSCLKRKVATLQRRVSVMTALAESRHIYFDEAEQEADAKKLGLAYE